MHTNKLKRKLADLGIDQNSSKLSESFCLIGTPLPPLEKSKDTGEFVPLWKQEVRDEKGRRRLHGAFTGGFSAGYYNTVGSAEGWTPSTFVSSRADRANKKQTRPEDYMDEEDLAEIRDAQKLVDTAEESDLFTSAPQDSVADALQKLIPPARDSIGSRLLRKMGWKPGQGIGPKITYHQLKLQERQLRSLTGWTGLTGGEEGEDEEAKKHLYPPRDTPLVVYQRKDNAFGIGFSPGSRLEAPANPDSTATAPRLSAGFGLGALNDADDDDLDVYDHSNLNKSHQRHLAFDESETHEEHGQTQRPIKVKQPEKAELFSNGAPVLLGFALSKLSVSDDQWFEASKPPDGWEPDPRRVWSITAEETKAPNLDATSRRLTADERGAALGETPLPSAPKSVFDYLSPKDRERLRNLAAGTINTLPGPEDAKQEESETAPGAALDPYSVPQIDLSTAKAALSGFQPFHTDPAKAARYTAYLKSQAEPEEYPASQLRPALGQTRDAFYHELREFAKSATIFKPAAGILGGRFATAKVVERLDSGKEGLYIPASGEEYEDDTQKLDEPEKKEDPKVNAAKLGMFGALTRTVQEWDPAKLLCKRFGVKEPVRELPMETSTLANGENDWKAQMPSQPQASLGTETQTPIDNDTMKAASASFRIKGNDLSNVGLGEDDGQGRDTLTYVKPERDIFKAIFESDDEEDKEDIENVLASDLIPVPVIPESVQASEDLPAKLQTNTTVGAASYLTAGSSSASAYTPSSAKGMDGVVDMSTFRPTFKSKKKDAEKDKEKKKSKDKERWKGKVILSFEDEGEGGLVLPQKPKPKKSKKEKAVVPVIPLQVDEDDADMWVEKPPAEGLTGTADGKNEAMDVDTDSAAIQPSGGAGRRLRAVDFL